MSDLKMRIYFGSIAAVNVTGDGYEFEPFCLLVPSIEIAAEEAKVHVFRHWPVEDGWHDHAAVIAPMPAYMYKTFGDAAAAGVLDILKPTEQQTLFKYHDGSRAEWPQTIH